MRISDKEGEKKGWPTRGEEFVIVRERRPRKKENEKLLLSSMVQCEGRASFKCKTM